MSNHEMTWQRIAHLDSFLAGSIAARGHEWWDETTAEQEADSVNLQGEARSKFLEGWQYELEEAAKERERERKAEREQYLDEIERQASKGDPAR